MAEILVIDDEASFREGLMETLSDLGHQATGVPSVREALQALTSQKFAAVFIDYRMPDMDGLEGIKQIQDQAGGRSLPIVMLTAHLDSQNTISAMKLGAFDHLTKPVRRREIETVLQKILKDFSDQPREVPPIKRAGNETLVGQSPQIREVMKMIGKLAASDSTVLLTGETGTGKELVAQAIHAHGDRGRARFVAINCAAIPENLLESELFGHVKGAYTGATADRIGSFQQADRGTLFLDEIGDLSFTLQAKLLRALQEREIVPLGSGRAVPIDVRVIAATHQNLQDLVSRREFREDLYYRLSVVPLHLPALRERAGDLDLLVPHFLRASQKANHDPHAKQFSPAAWSKLRAHAWPGNVRELRNVIERAVVLARGTWIDESDVQFSSGRSSEPPPDHENGLDLPSAVAALEKRLIEKALRESQGNRSEASRKLGIQRQLLYAKIKDYNLN